jgi:hypothetical protein
MTLILLALVTTFHDLYDEDRCLWCLSQALYLETHRFCFSASSQNPYPPVLSSRRKRISKFPFLTVFCFHTIVLHVDQRDLGGVRVFVCVYWSGQDVSLSQVLHSSLFLMVLSCMHESITSQPFLRHVFGSLGVVCSENLCTCAVDMVFRFYAVSNNDDT